ncbi:MAG: zinc-binding dehydrogenase [Mycobacteriales bacterium]
MWAHHLIESRTFAKVTCPTPTEGDLPEGQVLLRVLAGGICGSDLPLFSSVPTMLSADNGWDRGVPPGYPLHEVVGEVLASRDPAIETGSRVVGWASRFDGLSEYIVTDGEAVWAYDPALEPTTAVMLQPLACVLDAMDKMPDPAGIRAVVLGQGPIGLLFSHVLRTRGANAVLGVDAVDRSDVAEVFGVTRTITSTAGDWAMGVDSADRPDLVVEAIGHNDTTLNDAVRAVAPGGHIYQFGMPDGQSFPFHLYAFLRKNLRLTAGLTVERRRALAAAGAYLAQYPDLAKHYVTDVFPVDEVQQAFELAVVPRAGRLKVTLATS